MTKICTYWRHYQRSLACLRLSVGATLLSCHWAFAQDAAPALAPVPPESSAHTTADRNTSTVLPAREGLTNQARRILAAVEPPPHPIWITVADTEVLGFWQDDMSGAPQGAILMLHAAGQSPRWPDTLLNLHHNLPRFGWATLSIELPATVSRALPPRQVDSATTGSVEAEGSTEAAGGEAIDERQVVHEDTADTATAVDEATPPPPTHEQVEQQVENAILAAIEFIKQRNIHNIVLYGEGLGAARALAYAGSTLGAAEDSSLQALVLVDIDKAEPTTESYAAALASFKRPVLDLTTGVGSAARAQAAHRRQLSLKVRHPVYFTRNLLSPPMPATNGRENTLSKAVRGFISRRAGGREL